MHNSVESSVVTAICHSIENGTKPTMDIGIKKTTAYISLICGPYEIIVRLSESTHDFRQSGREYCGVKYFFKQFFDSDFDNAGSTNIFGGYLDLGYGTPYSCIEFGFSADRKKLIWTFHTYRKIPGYGDKNYKRKTITDGIIHKCKVSIDITNELKKKMKSFVQLNV